MHIFKNSFRLTKTETTTNAGKPPLPILHAIAYSLLAIIAALAFTFFLIIRREGVVAIPAALDFVIWVVFAALGIFLYSKLNRRIGWSK